MDGRIFPIDDVAVSRKDVARQSEGKALIDTLDDYYNGRRNAPKSE